MKTRHFIYALSLLACVSSSALAKDLNLPVVSKGFQHEFWQTVKMGTEAAAKELGDKTSYVGPADETQIAEQIQLVENAMAQKPNGSPRRECARPTGRNGKFTRYQSGDL